MPGETRCRARHDVGGPPAGEGTPHMHSAATLLHRRMNVEDVSIRITHVEGAMTPWLGRQLLDPLHRQAFQPGILSINICDFQLNEGTVIRRASHRRNPKCLTLGLAPQGEGAGIQGTFNIVVPIDLGLDL